MSKPPFLQTKEQIERRARPNGYAMMGFLGPNDSFKEVLKKDWETVGRHNTTHEEIVNHLRSIIKLADAHQHESDHEIVHVTYNGQPLDVSLCATRGLQYDIFNPPQESDRNVDTPKAWNDDIFVKNTKNGVSVVVTTGTLSYIREFGFYEGGDGKENRYRVDPEKVIAILSGN